MQIFEKKAMPPCGGFQQKFPSYSAANVF